MIEELKNFLFRGNIVELAVAFVMGLAFAAVITSLVDNLIMPVIAMIIGKPDFSDLTFTINDAVFRYGAFITSVIQFLAIGAAVFFFVVKPVQMMAARGKEPIEEGMPDEERRHQELLAALRVAANRRSRGPGRRVPAPSSANRSDLVAEGRGVPGRVDRPDRDRVRPLALAVGDRVAVADRGAELVEHAVEKDLVHDQRLRIGVVRRLIPIEPDLGNGALRRQAQVLGDGRRRPVGHRRRRHRDGVALGGVAEEVADADREGVRRLGHEPEDGVREIAERTREASECRRRATRRRPARRCRSTASRRARLASARGPRRRVSAPRAASYPAASCR